MPLPPHHARHTRIDRHAPSPPIRRRRRLQHNRRSLHIALQPQYPLIIRRQVNQPILIPILRLGDKRRPVQRQRRNIPLKPIPQPIPRSHHGIYRRAYHKRNQRPRPQLPRHPDARQPRPLRINQPPQQIRRRQPQQNPRLQVKLEHAVQPVNIPLHAPKIQPDHQPQRRQPQYRREPNLRRVSHIRPRQPSRRRQQQPEQRHSKRNRAAHNPAKRRRQPKPQQQRTRQRHHNPTYANAASLLPPKRPQQSLEPAP